MGKRTYTVWQVGWEADMRKVMLRDDEEADCPACQMAGLPPQGIEVDPIVIGFRAEGSEVETYRTVSWLRLGAEVVVRKCTDSTETDKIFARDRAEAARQGKAEHWHNGVRVQGGVS